MSHSSTAVAGTLALALTLIGLCGCAPAAGTAQAPGPSAADQAAEGGTVSAEGTVITDGPVDPEQTTRRSGPAVDFGGPPFGEQGDPEFESDGVWCVTVGFFWGGGAPPENVTFTVTGITSAPEGALTAELAVCGGAGAEDTCMGLVIAPDSPFIACSVRVRATGAFDGRAELGFAGTLECTQAAYCDAAIARDVERGSPIVIQQGS